MPKKTQKDPHAYDRIETITVPWVDVRDWFAGLAMQAGLIGAKYENCDKMRADFSMLAKLSYEIADSMLEERAKGGK